jgi:hypothetical protein
MSNEQLALILKFIQDHGVSKEQLIAAVIAWWQVTEKQEESK